MAATAEATVRGHQEVGFVISAVDTPLGKTAEDAVSLQLDVTTIDLFSSQSKMPEDTGITQVAMKVDIKSINGAAKNIGRLIGLADTAFTGDLSADTNEVLTVEENTIGETERAIYSEGPGPLLSTRRIYAQRCKLASIGPLVQAKTGWMLPSVVWNVLNPTSGAPLTITDTPAS
jgi:hypothetical protein